MFKVIFPKRTNQRYWDIHYKYVLNVFIALKCDITFEERSGFVVTINNESFLFDYADTNEVPECSLRIFKFHTTDISNSQVIPFTPVSFYNWEEYFQLASTVKYLGLSDLISCRQRPYGNATKRRKLVQTTLYNQYGKNLLTETIPQHSYFQEIGNIFLPVFVPGYCNNMLDRGCLQYMALGSPLITTNIPEYLPFNEKAVSGKHYVQCKDDYSDLIEKIEFHRNFVFVDYFRQIGNDAKELFQRTSTPERLGQWILQNL